MVTRGEILFEYVRSSDNHADFLTKLLSGKRTSELVEKLGLELIKPQSFFIDCVL